MTTATVDEALLAGAREAMAEVRRAEFALLEAVGAIEGAGVAGPAGYRSTPRLLEDLLRVDPAEAKRLVAHADRLGERVAFSGEPLEPRLPATAQACAAGAAGSEHVRVVARVMDAVSRVPGLGPDVVAEAEAVLARSAATLAPRGVEKVGARLLATVDPDGVAPLDPAEPEDELHLRRRRRDGALNLDALICGSGDAEMLLEVLDALAAPAGPDDTRTLGRRRAEALLDLAAQALAPAGIAADDNEGDRVPGSGRTTTDDASPETPPTGRRPRRAGCPSVRVLGRALLSITIDQRWLRDQVGHGVLDSGYTVSPAEARRLACDAGIVPAVLGTRSEPLDVGRLSYTIPDGMRRALHARDGGCTFPGCTRRPKRCHAHHVVHWADDGDTKIDNVTLLCRYHHHLVHHGHWQIHMREGRPWFTPPAWIDHTRTPRPGGRHPLLS